MPRGGSRSRSSSGSRFSSGNQTRSTFTSSRPMNQNPTSSYTNSSYKSPGMMSGMGGALMTGMAFGAGSQVAHNLIRGVTGSGGHSYVQNQQTLPPPGTVAKQPQIQNNPCFGQMQELSKCISNNQQNISQCQSLFDHLKDCRIANHLQ